MNLQKLLNDFATRPLQDAAIALFKNLGYRSEINQIDRDMLNTLKFDEVADIHFLNFQQLTNCQF